MQMYENESMCNSFTLIACSIGPWWDKISIGLAPIEKGEDQGGKCTFISINKIN